MPLLLSKPSKHEPRPFFIRPEYRLITGKPDLAVGLLLTQIAFWYTADGKGQSKIKVLRYGHWWIAKSREEWLEETGLTIKQYRRAVRVLQDLGMIEVRQMLFHNSPISHLRLLDEATVPTGEPTGPGCVILKGPSAWDQRAHAIYTESTTETTSQRSCERETNDERRRQDETGEEIGADMKAEEILKRKRDVPSGSLSAFWQKHLNLVSGRVKELPLTLKESSQLKSLHRACGIETREVIQYAIAHWWIFASTAGSKAGHQFPSAPHIGFLLKHVQVALDLLHPPAEIPVCKPDPFVSSLPFVEAPKKPVFTQQDLDDVLDYLKE